MTPVLSNPWPTPPPSPEKEAKRKCPPSPYRPTKMIRCHDQAAVRMTQDNLMKQIIVKEYEAAGLQIGNEVGVGTFSVVYQNKANPQEVFKLPHYKLGKRKVEKWIADTLRDQEKDLRDLIRVKIESHTTPSGKQYLTQPYFPKKDFFNPQRDREKMGFIYHLFDLCDKNVNPPLDLAPSNLVWIGEKLAIIDSLLPEEDCSYEGTLFQLHRQSLLEQYT